MSAETDNNATILAMYIDAKADYRNALNLEQSILAFSASILAVFTAAGVAMYPLHNPKLVWMIFSIVTPFFLVLVNILYMHQKHRSKVYKYYIVELEYEYYNELVTFERWREDARHVDGFVRKRKAFKYGAMAIALLNPYLYMSIGFLFYVPKKADVWYLVIYAVVFLIVLVGEVMCVKYLKSISKLQSRSGERN